MSPIRSSFSIRYRVGLRIAITLVLLALPAWAASPSATLKGRVVDEQGIELPGVKVIVQAPALKGERTALTSAEGVFQFPRLPYGTYRLHFELDGFAAAIQSLELSADQATIEDVTLEVLVLSDGLLFRSCDWQVFPADGWNPIEWPEELAALPVRSLHKDVQQVSGTQPAE